MPPEPQTNGSDLICELLATLMAFKRGDFSALFSGGLGRRVGKDCRGNISSVIEINHGAWRMNSSGTRQVVGKEGRITQRASIGQVTQHVGLTQSSPSTI